MQRLGQHFLRDASALAAAATALSVVPGDTIIEVGAGHGELTERLANKKGGVKLFAIEKDPALARGLRGKFKDAPGVTVIEGDIRKELAPLVAALPGAPYKITGNIPYYLTGYLFRLIEGLPRKPSRCVFIIQKEVAERLADAPPRMNRLAAAVQFWAHPRRAAVVPRTAFSPTPKVDSALIVLETKPAAPAPRDAYYRLIRRVFAQPRKTILNNLQSAGAGRLEKSDIAQKLETLGLSPSKRPQDLSFEDLIALVKIFEP